MSLKNEFIINSLLPVQSHVSSLTGTKDLHEGDEGASHEINNYFDELVAKKNGQRFTFSWNPAEKFKSTFTSIKADPKSKEKPRKFELSLTARLVEDGKLVWSRKLDFKKAFVKDAGPDPRMGGQFVDIDYESATPGKDQHY